MNLSLLRPGDIIVHDDCALFDAEVPALVIACETTNAVNQHRTSCHIVMLYFIHPPCIKELDISAHDAIEYRHYLQHLA